MSLFDRSYRLSDDGNFLIYQNGFTPKFIQKTIESRRLRGLAILELTKKDRIDSFDDISQLEFLEEMRFASALSHDFKFLNKFKNLRHLNIYSPNYTNMNLEGLVKLERLVINWSAKNLKGLESCTSPKRILLVEYKERNLMPIGKLENLDELDLRTASVETLDGIDELISLRRVALGGCKKLSGIKAMASLCEMKSLVFNGCKNIANYEDLSKLENLENIELVDCGNVGKYKIHLHDAQS